MTKKEFDRLYVGDRVAIHCPTKELNDEFLGLAESFGYKIPMINYDEYKDQTCFNIEGALVFYCYLDYYVNTDYKIAKFSSLKVEITGDTSDGYHTFNELYEHRTALFSVICNLFPNFSYKSWKHDDGTMYDGMFIVGIRTPKGHYSYHCEAKYYNWFGNVGLLEKAPEYDGHKPEDFTRLFYLVELLTGEEIYG